MIEGIDEEALEEIQNAQTVHDERIAELKKRTRELLKLKEPTGRPPSTLLLLIYAARRAIEEGDLAKLQETYNLMGFETTPNTTDIDKKIT